VKFCVKSCKIVLQLIVMVGFNLVCLSKWCFAVLVIEYYGCHEKILIVSKRTD
jgi:hypothetical protein